MDTVGVQGKVIAVFIDTFAGRFIQIVSNGDEIVGIIVTAHLGDPDTLGFCRGASLDVIAGTAGIYQTGKLVPVPSVIHTAFHSMQRIRKGLAAAMVGDGDGPVAPGCSLLDSGSSRRQSIHIGHGGMQMQFHTLLALSCIFTFGHSAGHHGEGLQHHLTGVVINLQLALHLHHITHVDTVGNGLGFGVFQVTADMYGRSIIGHIKADDPGITLFQFLVIHRKDTAFHNDAAHVPDIGLAASFDPVALDFACADLVIAAPSLKGNAISDKDSAHVHGEECGCGHHHHKGDDKFRIVHPDTNWKAGVEYGEQIGLGNRSYELINVR